MSEWLYLVGSVAHNQMADKYTGAPTAQNVDPDSVVVTSMGRDIAGNRVCLFTVTPDRQLLEHWNGGENIVVHVSEANGFSDVTTLPSSLGQAYQPHFTPDRLLVSNQVSLAPAGALAVVSDEVFTLSHVRPVLADCLNPKNTLESVVRGGVVIAAHDAQGASAMIVIPQMPLSLRNRMKGEACYCATRVAGLQVVPEPEQMDRILKAVGGSHRPVCQRLIVASDIKPTFGGGVS